MEDNVAGVTVSFVADPVLAARVRQIAQSDGITASQAAARASALGALLPASARRTLRFVLAEGGEDAQRQLAVLMTKAIAQVGNLVVERRLLASAQERGLVSEGETEEDLAEQSVRAVADYGRERKEAHEQFEGGIEPHPGQG
jgi:hypothetical protein